MLCSITWALDTGEWLGSRFGSFIPLEEGKYILTRKLLGPRDAQEVVKDKENTRHYRNSKSGVVQLPASSVDRLCDFLQEISSSEG